MENISRWKPKEFTKTEREELIGIPMTFKSRQDGEKIFPQRHWLEWQFASSRHNNEGYSDVEAFPFQTLEFMRRTDWLLSLSQDEECHLFAIAPLFIAYMTFKDE